MPVVGYKYFIACYSRISVRCVCFFFQLEKCLTTQVLQEGVLLGAFGEPENKLMKWRHLIWNELGESRLEMLLISLVIRFGLLVWKWLCFLFSGCQRNICIKWFFISSPMHSYYVQERWPLNLEICLQNDVIEVRNEIIKV